MSSVTIRSDQPDTSEEGLCMIQRKVESKRETFGQIRNVFKRFTLLCLRSFMFGESIHADGLGLNRASVLANPATDAECGVDMGKQ